MRLQQYYYYFFHLFAIGYGLNLVHFFSFFLSRTRAEVMKALQIVKQFVQKAAAHSLFFCLLVFISNIHLPHGCT